MKKKIPAATCEYMCRLTPPQAAIVDRIADEMRTTPGELLTALAMTRLDCTDERWIEEIHSALVAFVRNRRVPVFDMNELRPFGLSGRPAEPGDEAAATTEVHNA